MEWRLRPVVIRVRPIADPAVGQRGVQRDPLPVGGDPDLERGAAEFGFELVEDDDRPLKALGPVPGADDHGVGVGAEGAVVAVAVVEAGEIGREAGRRHARAVLGGERRVADGVRPQDVEVGQALGRVSPASAQVADGEEVGDAVEGGEDAEAGALGGGRLADAGDRRDILERGRAGVREEGGQPAVGVAGVFEHQGDLGGRQGVVGVGP